MTDIEIIKLLIICNMWSEFFMLYILMWKLDLIQDKEREQ